MLHSTGISLVKHSEHSTIYRVLCRPMCVSMAWRVSRNKVSWMHKLNRFSCMHNDSLARITKRSLLDANSLGCGTHFLFIFPIAQACTFGTKFACHRPLHAINTSSWLADHLTFYEPFAVWSLPPRRHLLPTEQCPAPAASTGGPTAFAAPEF